MCSELLLPEKEWEGEPDPPVYCVGVVFAFPSIRVIGEIVSVPVAPLRSMWLWFGICATVSVVDPTFPEIEILFLSVVPLLATATVLRVPTGVTLVLSTETA